MHFKSPLKSYELTTAPVVPLGDGGSYLDVSSLVIEVAFLVLLVFAVFLTRRKNVRASRILIVLAVAYPIIVGSLIALQLSN
ncbi:hypothetical protein RL72_01601 [Microbacterium azadirachtae]|uniref:Uncharacterized protein n=1 Tax=Microbacterium azadirachtae TaxID=582680 RepID=A0A0F0KVH7_9MICO|nr:hypothetical protein RL72_01601 [Microbacterium azadirachtae]